MSDADESREALKAAADYLSTARTHSKQMQLVAGAINKFLDNEKLTLDQAFGFKTERGKYARNVNESHIELVRKALLDHLGGKSWKIIAELNDFDEKEFRELRKRYKNQAIERMANKIHINFDD